MNLSSLVPLFPANQPKGDEASPAVNSAESPLFAAGGVFSRLHVQLTARWRCESVWPLQQQLIPDQLVWPRPCSRRSASNFLSFLGVPPGASPSFPVRLPVGAAVLPAGQSDGTVSPRRLHLRPQPEPESKHLPPHSLSQQSHDWLDTRC